VRILLIGIKGYVGSRLDIELHADGHSVIGCDSAATTTSSSSRLVYSVPYQALSDEALKGIDVILWFAGHSSVKIAESNRWASLQNNVTDLALLFRRAAERRVPIVYASSASILSSRDDAYSPIANEKRANAYDASKLAFDLLAQFVGGDYLCLRMATVSGWSPNMRWDLVFNAMNLAGSQEGLVRVTNASSFRSLFFMEDLVQYVRFSLRSIGQGTFPRGANQVALGSWSGSIGSLGAEIAEIWGVPMVFEEDTGTYSFVISDRQIRATHEQPAAFYQSMRSRCALFARQNRWKLP
jgi:nucleoside-diphosphate-sugar epimerase